VNVVSYAFFRNAASAYEHPNCGEARGKVFVNYLRLIVRAHHAVWNGWELRIAHDDRVREFLYFKALERMQDVGLLKLAPFGESKTLCGLGGMLERLRPVWEPGVDYVVCRDVDAVPMPKDRRAVEEFRASGKAVHVIHDASAHSGVMGGTLAVKAWPFRELVNARSLEQFIAQRGLEIDWNQHGSDQRLLNEYCLCFPQETLVHELHHLVGDLPGAEIRTRVDIETPKDINPDVATFGDTFSRIIGGCADVEAPYHFYDNSGSPDIDEWDGRPSWLRSIHECERLAGVRA